MNKPCFLTWLYQKTQMKRSSSFRQKPWTISLGKCLFLALFKTLIFRSKNHCFLSRIYKKTLFSDLITQKNPSEKSSIFGQKLLTNPLEKCRFWHFLELQFACLKIILFYPEYHKMTFTNLFSPKKSKWEKVWSLNKNHGLSPLENVDGLHFLKLYFSGLKIVLFSPEYQKPIFSDLISPKKHK